MCKIQFYWQLLFYVKLVKIQIINPLLYIFTLKGSSCFNAIGKIASLTINFSKIMLKNDLFLQIYIIIVKIIKCQIFVIDNYIKYQNSFSHKSHTNFQK